ncbi:16S rRNA (cytosine(1402)-N(4))-methyltransferase RsmH [bacterium]|nr:16S rRNA (cytosine(1402)-N(4))-methyltransferase RsmH [bacterium]
MDEETESTTPPAGHIPVLLNEVLTLLDIQPGQTIVDATVGLGGHSREIAERLGPTGRLIALDQDPESLRRAREVVSGCPVEWVHSNFGRIKEALQNLDTPQVDGLLADLGVSSPQLDQAERGFSFRRDGPLDMRMDSTAGPTAAELIAQLSERDLAWVFWEYGEERFSRQVAKRIVEARRKEPIRTTGELADLVRSVVPRPRGEHRRGGAGLDPATRVFQALRIAVNDELGSLDSLLAAMPSVIKPGGRVAIISFHSLEDRRVKHAFKDRETWQNLTKSIIVASDEEMRINSRSRSAKLRGARRLLPDESAKSFGKK